MKYVDTIIACSLLALVAAMFITIATTLGWVLLAEHQAEEWRPVWECQGLNLRLCRV